MGDVLLALQSIGGGNALAVSKDRGETWETKAMVPMSYTVMHQSRTGKIYVPSREEDVYTSDDLGETWNVETYGLPKIYSVAFLDDDRGIVVSNGKLFKTNDGGLNALQISSDFAISNLYYFNEDQMMFTTPQDGETTIKETENGGTTFTVKNRFCAETNSTYYDGDKTFWLAQNGGHINKHIFETLTSTSNILPSKSFSVTPNPSMKGQMIHLNVDFNSASKISLIDFSGRVVHQSMLQHSDQQIEIPNLSAGMYVLSLENETGRWVSTVVIR
jgi:hypothetical protein